MLNHSLSATQADRDWTSCNRRTLAVAACWRVLARAASAALQLPRGSRDRARRRTSESTRAGAEPSSSQGRPVRVPRDAWRSTRRVDQSRASRRSSWAASAACCETTAWTSFSRVVAPAGVDRSSAAALRGVNESSSKLRCVTTRTRSSPASCAADDSVMDQLTLPTGSTRKGPSSRAACWATRSRSAERERESALSGREGIGDRKMHPPAYANGSRSARTSRSAWHVP